MDQRLTSLFNNAMLINLQSLRIGFGFSTKALGIDCYIQGGVVKKQSTRGNLQEK